MHAMSQYAVVQLQGKQYRVAQGDILVLDRVPAKEKTKFDVTDVLLVVNGDTVTIGQPTVAKAKVTFVVQSHQRGEKIRVAKYKAKSRYRRVKGHRQAQSTVVVEKISA
ncbi:MAG: 50S ribosomal protein L21 [Candidatus Pacebacteria bacterium GW2011_GWB1_47_8]|nr:MAG: 50S ribosomal protein L21 [Candidatus Pacebacteria bacterium GW2011_GWA1_46_10]KKU84448.1 MAG: 50S ribosomal protein L21 [Candidatus Pacebacteria bacterium GW2011_GWB1_47_8]